MAVVPVPLGGCVIATMATRRRAAISLTGSSTARTPALTWLSIFGPRLLIGSR
jgi:hypothetical protein